MAAIQPRRSAALAKRAPDAIALLKADHRQVEAWFKEFEKTDSGPKKSKLARPDLRRTHGAHTDRRGHLLSRISSLRRKTKTCTMRRWSSTTVPGN